MNTDLLVQLTQHKSYWEGYKNIPHYSEFECDLGKLDTWTNCLRSAGLQHPPPPILSMLESHITILFENGIAVYLTWPSSHMFAVVRIGSQEQKVFS